MNTQKGIIKALLVAVATAFLSAPAIAASVDIYVATAADGGSDGNAGTESTPFLTLSNAVAQVDAAIAGGAESVTIHVAAGTYDIGAYDTQLILTNGITVIGNPSDPAKVIILNNSTTQRSVSLNHASAARGVEIADEALAKSNVPSVNVHLADGTYDITEDAAALSLTNAISLVGRPDAPSQVMILNNSASHQSVLLDNQDAALKGVTVARTDNDGTEGKGHVMINNAGLLEDCVITNGLIGSTMTAGYYNGGNVHMNNGGTLRRCKILDGRSLNPESEVGQATSYYSTGNLYVQTAVNAVLVENCLIAGGYAPDMLYKSKSTRTTVGQPRQSRT